MKQKIFYKVTSSGDRSCYLRYSQYCVKYKLGKWVTPSIPYSKLFVFNCIKAAKMCAGDGYYRRHIYKCIVKNPTRALTRANNNSDTSMLTYWKNRYQHKKNEVFAANQHTVYVDAVKLVKRVA